MAKNEYATKSGQVALVFRRNHLKHRQTAIMLATHADFYNNQCIRNVREPNQALLFCRTIINL